VAHRCRATDRPRPIEIGHQAAFCLAATYPDCPRYQAAAAPRRSVAITTSSRPTVAKPGDAAAIERMQAEVGAAGTLGAAGTPGAADNPGMSGILSTRDRPAMPWTLDRSVRPASPNPVNATAPPDRPDRADPSGRTRWRRAVVVVIAIAVLAVLAVAAYLASPAIVDWVRQVGAVAPAASTSPSAVPRTSPARASLSPVPTRTASPTPAPTTTTRPTPTPTPARTSIIYVVVRNDTLNIIAARYGVSVTAISKANRIADPSLIVVGQRLVIPPP
jgi:LysM repeat protein